MDKFKETREEAPRPVQEPSSCLKIVKCVGRRVFIKSIRLHEELFPPRSVTNACSPLPLATGPTAHTGYSCQAAVAAVSVHERVRSDSKNLTLVGLHKSEGTPFNSDADHPVSMAWRSLTDSKCPYPKQELYNCSEKER